MTSVQPNNKSSRGASAFGFAGLAVFLLMGASLPSMAQSGDASTADTLQVMVDAMLIDARCHEATVDFGVMMKYGQDHGVPAVDILPLGAKRASFDAASKRRSDSVGVDTLCTSVLAQDLDLVPGLFRSP